MQSRVFYWLGRQFVGILAEASAALSADEATDELLRRMDGELHRFGLSLGNTVRTRLWGRSGGDREMGSAQRAKVLSGSARCATSSYIAPGLFISNAAVAIDLLAMRPSAPDRAKRTAEFDPPVRPLRYLVYDDVIFLSGVTALAQSRASIVLPDLPRQVEAILARIGSSLNEAGASWQRVVEVSCHLHRSQTIGTVETLLRSTVPFKTARFECDIVDGWNPSDNLVEIEVTAAL